MKVSIINKRFQNIKINYLLSLLFIYKLTLICISINLRNSVTRQKEKKSCFQNGFHYKMLHNMLIFFSIYTFYVNFKNKYILKLNKHETLTQILVNSSRNSSIFFIFFKIN